MATYKYAPGLGKPPAAWSLSKAERRRRKAAAASMHRVAEGRRWGGKAELDAEAKRARSLAEPHGGPHPRPVWRIDVGQGGLNAKGAPTIKGGDLTGSAKTLAAVALDLGLDVGAASNGREVEVRAGRDGMAIVRVVFRGGRLVAAYAHDGTQYVACTLTAARARLEAVAS